MIFFVSNGILGCFQWQFLPGYEVIDDNMAVLKFPSSAMFIYTCNSSITLLCYMLVFYISYNQSLGSLCYLLTTACFKGTSRSVEFFLSMHPGGVQISSVGEFNCPMN
jgi:hypothetical protein